MSEILKGEVHGNFVPEVKDIVRGTKGNLSESSRTLQNQFGGVGSAHIDYDLAPYVDKSFKKHFRNALMDVLGWDKERAKKLAEKAKYDEDYETMLQNNDCGTGGLDVVSLDEYSRIWTIAHRHMEREGKQAAEGMYHNLNTLESRPGGLDCPFVQ